jgi:MscS family membrane protein
MRLTPALLLVLVLSGSHGFAQEPAQDQQAQILTPQVDVPFDEFDRGTPRRSLRGFLTATQNRDFETAAEYLDLRNLPSRMEITDGPELAHGLSIVIDRQLWIDFADISDHPDGTPADGLPSYRDKFAEIESHDEVISLLLQRIPRGDGEFIWKISNKTVGEIPELYEEFGYGRIEEKLIELLPDVTFLSVELFKWVIIFGVILIAYQVLLLLLRLISRAIANPSSPVHQLVRQFLTRPFLWLLILIIVNQVVYGLGIGIEAQRIARAQTVNIVIATWVLLSAANLFRAIYRNHLQRLGREGAIVLLGPVGNAVKILIVLFALLLWLNNLGFNITALLAGLGVGGVAVALALQKPLEDLFGAVSMYTQQPAKIGDFCKIGNTTGTIEEIGLRMTRLRTLGNTVVSIPNSKVAGDILDNYSVRQRIWYHPKLTLRYDSTRKQLNEVLAATRDLLNSHEKVLDDPARIRLTGFGREGFELDVFAYIGTSDYAEFLEVAEELNLGIIDVVAKSGTTFAVPLHMLDAGQ